MHSKHTKILLAASALFAVLNFSITIKPAKAFFAPWFGGPIIAVTPPTLICPSTILVFDYSTMTIVRLFRTPASIVYPHFNLFVPGTFVKGTDLPIPYPTCPLVVFPIVMVGTS